MPQDKPMTLSTKALSAAYKGGCASPIMVWQRNRILAAIKAFLSHPDSGYVPRIETEISVEDIIEWRRPRDVVVAETAMRVAQIERDEARAEAKKREAQLIKSIETNRGLSANATAFQRQMAALREALDALIGAIWSASYRKELYSIMKGSELRAAQRSLANTAAAAAQWVRVGEGWEVKPIEPTQAMLDAGYAAAAFPRDREICAVMYKAMSAAAPQAGEPPKVGCYSVEMIGGPEPVAGEPEGE